MDERHAVGVRAGKLRGGGQGWLASFERGLLSIGNRRHQVQVGADGLARRAGCALLAQTPGPCREHSGPLGQPQPGNRPLGKGFNLAGFEDAPHG